MFCNIKNTLHLSISLALQTLFRKTQLPTLEALGQETSKLCEVMAYSYSGVALFALYFSGFCARYFPCTKGVGRVKKGGLFVEK